MTFFDVISMAGVLLGMVAYTLMVSGRMCAATYRYMGANLLAAILVATSLIDHWNPATAILQIFYGGASLYGLVRLHIAQARCGEVPAEAPGEPRGGIAA